MERALIETRIKKGLAENKFTALREMIDSMTGDTSLINDLGLDSIQILELIIGLEKEFNFRCLPNELNLDMFDKFSRLVDFVEKKINTGEN